MPPSISLEISGAVSAWPSSSSTWRWTSSPALGELVAGAVAQVVLQAARLGLPRAAREVAVLDEVGQPRVDGVLVELEPGIRQALRDLGGGLVGQQPGCPPVKSRMIAM